MAEHGSCAKTYMESEHARSTHRNDHTQIITKNHQESLPQMLCRTDH